MNFDELLSKLSEDLSNGNISEDELIENVCQRKNEIGTWIKIANLLNTLLSDYTGEEITHDESYYRKKANGTYKKRCVSDNPDVTTESNIKIETTGLCQDIEPCVVFESAIGYTSDSEHDRKKDELYRERVKLRDQRREYNKLQAVDARAEHLNEELIDVCNKMNTTLPLIPFNMKDIPYEDNEERVGVCVFTDWHYGMVTDNVWNKYNTNICKRRVQYVVNKMCGYIDFHGLSKIKVVLLGDFSHGCCHVTCRVKSEEDVCDQLMHSTEIIAESINMLSNYVNEVEVYSCVGNHMRTQQSKKDSVTSDNLEKIVPWWIRQRLRDNPRVRIVDNANYGDYTVFDVLGHNVCCMHGDRKNFKNIGTITNNIFTQKHGKIINYAIMGDKHHLSEDDPMGIESILVRSLCGSDDYASDGDLFSKSGQTFIVFDKLGRECTYNITTDHIMR